MNDSTIQCPKGEVQPDRSYRYRCVCGGTVDHPSTMNEVVECTWCFGFDVERITAAMQEGVRGQRYYGLLKAFLSVQGKAIADEFKTMREHTGKATMVEIGYLSLRFNLNFKAICEWLEETRCLRSGTYDRINDSGWKVRDIYTAARERYPDLASIPLHRVELRVEQRVEQTTTPSVEQQT